MKIYTFKNGASYTEQEVIDYFYGRYWKLSYIRLNFREDLYVLFSALDKFGDITDGNT